MCRTDWVEIKTVEYGNMRVVYDYALDPYERPNDVFQIWEPADRHEGGVTVRNPEAHDPRREHMWWKSVNGTPADLAKEYAKQGRANPSKEAYDSMQKELLHYIAGDMYIARVRVIIEGEEVLDESLSFDHSSYLFDNTPEEEALARVLEYFGNVDDLMKRAREEAKKRAARLREIADAIEAVAGEEK